MLLLAVGQTVVMRPQTTARTRTNTKSEGECKRKGKNNRSTAVAGNNSDFNVVAGGNLAECGRAAFNGDDDANTRAIFKGQRLE